MSSTDLPMHARRLALAAGYVAANLVSVVISFNLTGETDGAAPIWTANAFVAAALLLLPRYWGAATAAICFAANIFLCIKWGQSPAISAFFAGSFEATISVNSTPFRVSRPIAAAQ